jgi:hypothetical protein
MLLKLTTIAAVFLVWVPVAQAWSWPVQGSVLQTFRYDEANPYAAGQHRGIDIGAGAAGGPVVAPASGTISFAGTVPTSGKCVTIETPDGYSVTLTHLGSIAVSKGASVAEGSVVGTVGPSGTPDFSVPYVHLGIRLSADANGYVDPLGLLPAPASPPSSSGGVPSSSASAGAPAGSGSPEAPTPTVSEPASSPSAAAAEPAGAGLVIHAPASAPAAARTATERQPARHAPTRPVHLEKRPAETVSKPRTFEGTVEEPFASRSTRPVRATPDSATLASALSAGPGILAALAALATAVVRRRRRPATLVRFPEVRQLRRAA